MLRNTNVDINQFITFTLFHPHFSRFWEKVFLDLYLDAAVDISSPLHSSKSECF